MIRISKSVHEDAHGFGGTDYVLRNQVPKAVLEGKSSPEFEIRMAPNIRIPISS